MTVDFNPIGDFELTADGLAPITYEPLVGEAAEIAQSLRRAISRRDAEASKGAVVQGDVKFRFPASSLASRPELGATLIDADGERWTILTVALETLGACWACVTRNLAIVESLDDGLVIEQAEFAKGDDGAIEPTWSEYETLAGRLQPIRTTIADEHEQSIARADFRVILAHDLDWRPDRRWRVRVGESTYAVVGYERAERIDASPALLVVRSPWPWN